MSVPRSVPPVIAIEDVFAPPECTRATSSPDRGTDVSAPSPSAHAVRVAGPLLVTQGDDDARVPRAESDAVLESLPARGAEVGYRVHDAEGRLFCQPENLRVPFGAVEDVLATHLRARES